MRYNALQFIGAYGFELDLVDGTVTVLVEHHERPQQFQMLWIDESPILGDHFAEPLESNSVWSDCGRQRIYARRSLIYFDFFLHTIFIMSSKNALPIRNIIVLRYQ